MNDDSGPDQEVAWQCTDYDGRYGFIVNSDDGFLQNGRDPYIKVYSNTGCAFCKTSGGGWYYSKSLKHSAKYCSLENSSLSTSRSSCKRSLLSQNNLEHKGNIASS
ncbi:MAG: hypothetical protein ACE5NN_03660 [Candidatus Bathyarchaeia archaeon]